MTTPLRSHDSPLRDTILADTRSSSQLKPEPAPAATARWRAPRPPAHRPRRDHLGTDLHASPRIYSGHADRCSRLCARARHLSPEDAALVLARFAHGSTTAHVAALAGTNLSTVRRRLIRLVTRLESSAFIAIASHWNRLSEDERRIARACILDGRSLRDAAARLRLTHHEVREARRVLLLRWSPSERR